MKRWYSILFGVLLLVAACGMGGQQSSSAADAESPDYAAFAYDAENMVAAIDKGDSPNNVSSTAESACHSRGGGIGCQAIGWFTHGYGAFAVGSNPNQWGWGASTSRPSAANIALSHCRSATTLDASACHLTFVASVNGPSFGWGNYSPLRSTYKIFGYIECQGDHQGHDKWAVDFDSTTNPDNTAVYPTRAGKVVYSDFNKDTNPPGGYPYYGNVVAIDHGDGTYSIYAHLKQGTLPHYAEQVAPDTPIGIMDSSGTDARHLHYAVRQANPGLVKTLAPFDGTAVRTPWRNPAVPPSPPPRCP